MVQGALFTRDYLDEGIADTEEWKALTDEVVDAFRTAVLAVYDKFPTGKTPSESRTEDDLIWKVLALLGWEHGSRQVNLSPKGMDHKPDGLLFADAEAKARADKKGHEYQQYREGVAIVESKRWLRELDRKGSTKDDFGVPSTQMIRYLDRLNIVTEGQVRWGILTNGRHWRLYYHGATSVSEEFLELDLATLVGLPGFSPSLFDGPPAHYLKVFMLMFGRAGFLPRDDGRTFHQLSRDEGRMWEQRVARDLSDLVFGNVFPALVRGIVDNDPQRLPSLAREYLDEVREAALILLYRLLFVLYAEDRNLLPTRHKAYDDYGMSKRVREDIAKRIDDGDPLAAEMGEYYPHMLRLFSRIDKGAPSIGLPPYNGGLFASDRSGARILERIELPDALFAPVIDALSRYDDGKVKRRINYRDLSVQQLGSIYERLLENEVTVVDGEVLVGGDGVARHSSGSFYTPEAPVQLIIAKAVGPLLQDRLDAFHRKAEEGANTEALLAADPATAMLDIKVCDPAMGSGHFLVSLVDYLGDRVLSAIAEAEALVPGYECPLSKAIETIRAGIMAHAEEGKWPIHPEQLEDRLIVRRMILKRVVYGVDKNPMAVELAKLALWLHTFTVGAPLSFLEHHLRCGDSICGEWVRPVWDELDRRGAIFIKNSVIQAKQTAQGMARIERLADADVSEVRLSKETFATVTEATEPLARFLDFMLALKWLPTKDKTTAAAIQAFLDKQFGDPVQVAACLVKPTAAAPREQPALIPDDQPQQGMLLTGNAPERTIRAAFVKLLSEVRALARRERFLHWQVAFPGVWQDWESAGTTGGFDAVIGNPPYVRQELLGPAKPYLKDTFACFDGMADLYVYFYEQGLRLLKPGGRLSLIVTNKWMKAGYAEALRRLFADKAWVETVVDFGHAKQIFPDADVFPCVIVARRPTLDPAPATARVCVIDRDRLDLDRLITQVDEGSFDMPRDALAPSGWNLEPPAVLALMDKIRAKGVPLKEFLGAEPLYGLKTGFNDAFLMDQATRDRLIEQDNRLDSIIRPYLRGQDLDRWTPGWNGLWMVVMKSSANHLWPWATAANETKAEEVFRATYPALHAHMMQHEARLRGRQDQGRYWWELRACAYYEAFAAPKLFYQEIQFYPCFSFDGTGQFGNNKTFFLPSDDKYLLGVLNSPLMWWHNWRYLPHMKDDALSPTGIKMVGLPIARPSPKLRAAIEPKVARLIAIKAETAKATTAILDWLRVEYEVTKISQRLAAPATLGLEDFLSEVKKGRKGRLTPAALAELKQGYTGTVEPVRALIGEANTLERKVSDLVNQAYGLTAEEVALMWKTAPPRMPFTP